jgi:hypothetical protein
MELRFYKVALFSFHSINYLTIIWLVNRAYDDSYYRGVLIDNFAIWALINF